MPHLAAGRGWNAEHQRVHDLVGVVVGAVVDVVIGHAAVFMACSMLVLARVR